MNLYMEYMGGLGDAILRLYFSAGDWYSALDRLGPQDKAKVVLMSHSPYLHEVFRWHPNVDQIEIADLGFNTPFHPWENKIWRLEHGLISDSPCPPYSPAKTLKFYPSPADMPMLERLKNEKFIVLAATSSIETRSIPAAMRQEIASIALMNGFKVLVVGRRHYFKDGRQNDIKVVDGVIDAVEILTVPGTIEAIKLSKGVVTAHSAALHMAWQEYRPAFLLYNKETQAQCAPFGAVGYMQGKDRPDTDHMEFSAYNKGRFLRWMEKL